MDQFDRAAQGELAADLRAIADRTEAGEIIGFVGVAISKEGAESLHVAKNRPILHQILGALQEMTLQSLLALHERDRRQQAMQRGDN